MTLWVSPHQRIFHWRTWQLTWRATTNRGAENKRLQNNVQLRMGHLYHNPSSQGSRTMAEGGTERL